MTLKSLNIAVNDYCNSKCIMCKMGENKKINYLSVNDFKYFFENNSFSEVEEISISGGEPFMREDLARIADVMITNLPNLKKMFFNTNGAYEERVKTFVEHIAPRIRELYGAVSIEGNEGVHNGIRGIKGYKIALETLTSIANSKYPNVKAMILTTITSKNQDIEQLHSVRNLAEELKCAYTFRLADVSNVYYLNQKNFEDFKPSGNLEDIANFIDNHKSSDPFLRILKQFILTGKVDIMEDKDGRIKCRAGDIFAFIDARGNAHPCIYSSRIIGRFNEGFIPKKIDDLGKYEPCPCLTECTIYPMLNYCGN